MKASPDQIRWFRLRHSGLHQPFPSPGDAAAGLVGVQAQILPAAAIALFNRSAGEFSYSQFTDLLYVQRTLVRLWGQRGTLHVYVSQDWPLIYAAMSIHGWWEPNPHRDGLVSANYLATIDAVAEAMKANGPFGRKELRALGLELDEWMLNPWGGIFGSLVYRGLACHAGQEGNQALYAHRAAWLPDLEWNPPSAEDANRNLLRRYLSAYGPASLSDFTYWRRCLVGDARRWAADLRDEVVEIEGESARNSLILLKSDLDELFATPPPAEDWPVVFVGRFDPLLLGHKDKAWVIEDDHYDHVWRPAGHIEACVLEHGRIAGTWRYDRAGKGLTFTVRPLGLPSASLKAAVAAYAPRLARFFGQGLKDVVYA